MLKKLLTIFLLFSTLIFAKDVKPVNFVDDKKFSGLWYEIARTYNSFQDRCVASSVEYTYLEPFTYRLDNRCFDTNIGGELISYTGKGTSAFGENMNVIKTTYFWIFSKNYKIIYLNEDYTSFVMTDDELESLWIMHRNPFMSKEELTKIENFVDDFINLIELIYTPQDKDGRYK